MSSYDDWKTDPDYGMSNDQLLMAELRSERDEAVEKARKLTDALEEILDICKDEYDVDPDPSGGHHDVPNKWMRIGTMIEEVLYGPGQSN